MDGRTDGRLLFVAPQSKLLSCLETGWFSFSEQVPGIYRTTIMPNTGGGLWCWTKKQYLRKFVENRDKADLGTQRNRTMDRKWDLQLSSSSRRTILPFSPVSCNGRRAFTIDTWPVSKTYATTTRTR